MSVVRRADIEAIVRSAPRIEGNVAAGGPVATLQHTLAARLSAEGVAATLAAPYAPAPIEAAISVVSRWTGYVALAGAVVVTFRALFG